MKLLIANSLVETINLENKSLRSKINHSSKIAYHLTPKGKQTLEQIKPFFMMFKNNSLTNNGDKK